MGNMAIAMMADPLKFKEPELEFECTLAVVDSAHSHEDERVLLQKNIPAATFRAEDKISVEKNGSKEQSNSRGNFSVFRLPNQCQIGQM